MLIKWVMLLLLQPSVAQGQTDVLKSAPLSTSMGFMQIIVYCVQSSPEEAQLRLYSLIM